jgi:hypothetical protein
MIKKALAFIVLLPLTALLWIVVLIPTIVAEKLLEGGK